MKNRRSASVTRTIPSTADISEQTKRLFENAGNDIKPIRLKNASEASKEIEYLENNIAEGVEWNDQVSSMQRGMGLVNGGALEYDNFLRGLNRIYSGLVAAATNLRSALVKQSCLFIAQLARETGPSIDLIGDFISPLSSQLSHGTQIIAESCKLAILCISKNCYSRKVLKSIFDICGSRGAAVKTVAAEALSLVLLHWPNDLLNQNFVQIESFLQKLLSDAAVNTRAFARQATKAYQMNFPQKASTFISKLDQRTQRAINDCQISTEVSRKTTQIPVRTNSDSVREIRRPSSRSSQSRTLERVDIAANPPRIMRPKKVEDENEYQKPNEYALDEPQARKQRKPSVGDNFVRRRASLNASRSNYEIEEQANNFKKRFSVNEDQPIRRKKEENYFNDDDDDNVDYITPSKQKYSFQNQQFETQKYKTQPRYEPLYNNNEDDDDDDDDFQNNSIKYRSKNSKQYQQQLQNSYQLSRVSNAESRGDKNYRLKYSQNQNDDDFLPNIRYRPKRQSSVQPQRKDESKWTMVEDPDDINYFSKMKQQKIQEKKKPIQLVSGDEKNYLQSLQSFVDDDKVSDLATSMTYISRDLVSCCSNKNAVISSQALSILLSILPIYAPHFRSILPSLVETVLEQAESGNPRSSNTAKQILNELHRSFDSNTLLLICTTQPPSVPLLNFTDSLVSLNDVDIGNDTICQKLITLAFKCYNIGSISNRRTAARIIEHVNNANSQALKKFTDSLRDQQLKQFDEFIRPYLPNIQIREIITECPRYNSKNTKSWLHKVASISSNLQGDDWIEMRPSLYAELNEALKDKKEPEITLNLVYKIFTNHDVEDFQILLPGLLANIRDKTSDIVDSILTLVVNDRDPAEVFASLQPVITGSDPEISRAALGFQTFLISKIGKNELKPQVSSLIPGLTKSFESQVPEVRKAVVLCFVELYTQFDKEFIDRHTSHLSRGQQKLIGIYLNRRAK